jgi:hypothetical protein
MPASAGWDAAQPLCPGLVLPDRIARLDERMGADAH